MSDRSIRPSLPLAQSLQGVDGRCPGARLGRDQGVVEPDERAREPGRERRGGGERRVRAQNGAVVRRGHLGRPRGAQDVDPGRGGGGVAEEEEEGCVCGVWGAEEDEEEVRDWLGGRGRRGRWSHGGNKKKSEIVFFFFCSTPRFELRTNHRQSETEKSPGHRCGLVDWIRGAERERRGAKKVPKKLAFDFRFFDCPKILMQNSNFLARRRKKSIEKENHSFRVGEKCTLFSTSRFLLLPRSCLLLYSIG